MELSPRHYYIIIKGTFHSLLSRLEMPPAESFCQRCKNETKYRCLTYQASVYNRPECNVAAPEETENWKADKSVALCLS